MRFRGKEYIAYIVVQASECVGLGGKSKGKWEGGIG